MSVIWAEYCICWKWGYFKVAIENRKTPIDILVAVVLLELVGSELLSYFGGYSQAILNQAQLSVFGNITSVLQIHNDKPTVNL